MKHTSTVLFAEDKTWEWSFKNLIAQLGDREDLEELGYVMGLAGQASRVGSAFLYCSRMALSNSVHPKVKFQNFHS